MEETSDISWSFQMPGKQILVYWIWFQHKHGKAWIAINKLLIIMKSDLSDKRRDFLKAVFVSVLLYGCTSWNLRKHMERKLDGNHIRMFPAFLKPGRSLPVKLLASHLKQHQNKSCKICRANCWLSNDKLITNVFLWTPTYGQTREILNGSAQCYQANLIIYYLLIGISVVIWLHF